MNSQVNTKRQLFDLWALSYDWLFPSVFYQAIHKRLGEYVQLPNSAHVLDLGCGTGRLLDRLANQFPDLQGTGVDFSTQMLAQARRRNRHHPRLIFVQGNAEALPFATEQFDAVFNTFSFLHYPHPETVFAEVSRVLRPGGNFYLVDPVPGRWQSSQAIATVSGKIAFYSPTAREQLGQSVGLKCLKHQYLLSTVVLSLFVKTQD